MYNYIIKGGSRLSGELDVSGSKNATLPILAATILNGKVSKLYNVPDISDVQTTLKILEELGCKIKKDKKKLVIDSRGVSKTMIPEDLIAFFCDYCGSLDFSIWRSKFHISRRMRHWKQAN